MVGVPRWSLCQLGPALLRTFEDHRRVFQEATTWRTKTGMPRNVARSAAFESEHCRPATNRKEFNGWFLTLPLALPLDRNEGSATAFSFFFCS